MTTQPRRRRRSRADAEPRGAGQLQLHADQRSVRQLHRPHHAARRRDAGRLRAGHRRLPGTLPDGTPYSVPTFIPNAAKVAAGGNGFLTTNMPGYSTDYHGLELGVVKRLSNRWMGRVGFSFNNAREHFERRRRRLRHQRQPDADAHRTARRRRPVRAAERRQRLGQHLHQREVAVQRERDVSGAVRHRGQRQRVRAAGLSVPALPPGHDRCARRATRRCRSW